MESKKLVMGWIQYVVEPAKGEPFGERATAVDRSGVNWEAAVPAYMQGALVEDRVAHIADAGLKWIENGISEVTSGAMRRMFDRMHDNGSDLLLASAFNRVRSATYCYVTPGIDGPFEDEEAEEEAHRKRRVEYYAARQALIVILEANLLAAERDVHDAAGKKKAIARLGIKIGVSK